MATTGKAGLKAGARTPVPGVAYNRGVSVWLRHPAELRRFFKLRSGQAKRRWLDQWLEELAASDAAKARPAGPEQDPALLKATGFGPEHHQA